MRGFRITLRPGFGRKRCPVCGAGPYRRCTMLSWGRHYRPRDTRHYERYALESAPVEPSA